MAGQATEKILKENPDLKGIYMTSHGEEGVCQMLSKYGRAGTVKMIANDFMGKNYELMRAAEILYVENRFWLNFCYRILFQKRISC